MGYKRFRHFGKDKVTMDFAFFAIAFDIKKMAAKMKTQGNLPTNEPQSGPFNESYKLMKRMLGTYKPDVMKIAV